MIQVQDIQSFLSANPWVGKLLISLIGLLIVMILQKIMNKILYARIDNKNAYHMAKKTAYYSIVGVYIILLFIVWADATGEFTTYVGLLSAGIAIALRELFANIAAWIYIMIKRPFISGDRIALGENRGDVIDIRTFQFTLMEVTNMEDGEQSTGKMIEVPNHFIFHNTLVNYSKGFNYIWNEIKIEITFESNWEKAKEVFMKVLEKNTLYMIDDARNLIEEAAKKYLVSYNKITPIVYTDVKASGVQLTLRYLCEPRQRRTTINNIWEDILRAIANDPEIELAYPTKRVVNK